MHGREVAGQGEGGLDAQNNALLLERLAQVPDEQRTARFRCVVAYVETATAKPELVEATCEGRILAAPRGGGGFRYDPLVLSTHLRTNIAQAPPAAKQRRPHPRRPLSPPDPVLAPP